MLGRVLTRRKSGDPPHLSTDLGKHPVVWMLLLGCVNLGRLLELELHGVEAGVHLDAHGLHLAPSLLVALLFDPVEERDGLRQPLGLSTV